jgi:anaerobic sulfite reductase subunit A
MAYQLSHEMFNRYISGLRETHRVFAPVVKANKNKLADLDLVTYDEVRDSSDIIWSEKSYFSPKEIFYPIRETLFQFVGDKAYVPEVDQKPMLILLRPCDLNGIDRLDQIFFNNGINKDFYYERRRKLVKFAVIECLEGFDTCFCVSMSTNKVKDYDMALKYSKDGITVDVKDNTLIPDGFSFGESTDFILKAIEENKVKVVLPNFEGVDLQDVFDHPMWKEYTSRCIACGRCNTSCITCSCFTMQDVFTDDNKQLAERRRRWAGCHIKGFSTMAGGHSFRDKNGERMRFKLMHKVYDFNKRFNKHMCVGCGRCDDVCPEYISFSNSINKVTQIIEEVKNDK